MRRWAFAVLGLFAAGCFTQSEVPPPKSPTGEEPSEERKVQFAEDRAPAVKVIPFDAKRAMGYLETLCDIGPRICATGGMKKQQDLLKKHFTDLGGRVRFQPFDVKQPSRPNKIECQNMIVTWHPERKRRVILCGHYDTRPLADQEMRRADWEKPFVSANDGTSTTAFLMELAHVMKDFPSSVGVDFVIFDAEEYIFDKDRGDKYFLGSEHFAKDYKENRPGHEYVAAVLFDLFAGKGAKLKPDGTSLFYAGGVVEEIWAVAAALKAKSFTNQRGQDVLDDHLALNLVGIPAIDIIDFDYEHWHKLSDTPSQCSGEQMAEVAKVITTWLQGVK